MSEVLSITEESIMTNIYGRPRGLWANGISSTAQPSKKITLTPPQSKRENSPLKCCSCGSIDIIPGLCYTGKVLVSESVVEREKAILLKATLEFTTKVIRVPIGQYVRGFICDSCASSTEIRTIGRRETRKLPVIVVDAIPAMQPRDSRIGGKSQKTFNTRITQ